MPDQIFSYMVSRKMGGITPESWGPYVWGAIHLICLGAPDQLSVMQQTAYRAFFERLPMVIPCQKCAEHLKENLHKVPLDGNLSTQKDLFAWSVRLHNLVNEQLKKPTMTLEAAQTYWDAICKRTIQGCQHPPHQEEVAIEKKNGYPGFVYLGIGMILGMGIMFLLSLRQRSRTSHASLASLTVKRKR